MALVLLRAFCLPCELCGKACSKCCKVFDDICRCGCSNLDRICSTMCEDPVACCSTSFMLFAITMGALIVTSFTKGVGGCSTRMLAWVLVTIFASLVNVFFSFYAYRKINGWYEEDIDPETTTSQRAVDFFENDVWFALFICFSIAEIVWGSLGLAWSSECSSEVTGLVNATAILLIVSISLGATLFILFVCGKYFETMSKQPCWWLIPCLWPCLCLGSMSRHNDEKVRNENHRRVANHQRDNKAWSVENRNFLPAASQSHAAPTAPTAPAMYQQQPPPFNPNYSAPPAHQQYPSQPQQLPRQTPPPGTVVLMNSADKEKPTRRAPESTVDKLKNFGQSMFRK